MLPSKIVEFARIHHKGERNLRWAVAFDVLAKRSACTLLVWAGMECILSFSIEAGCGTIWYHRARCSSAIASASAILTSFFGEIHTAYSVQQDKPESQVVHAALGFKETLTTEKRHSLLRRGAGEVEISEQ